MRRLSLLALALAVLAACSGAADGPRGPRRCSSDGDCGDGWCVQQACVVDAAPVARIDAPASLRTNAPATFTATISDPDAGDAIASARWTITAETDGCEADLDEATPSALHAIFWCPGTYRVELAATDLRGVEGRAAPVVVTVAASPSAPYVVADPDVSVPHRCAGTPLGCEIVPQGDALVQLGAVATDPDGGPLTYAWTTFPPEATAGAAALEPGPDAALPGVRITSAGGALAGTWRFRVRVTDAEGPAAQALQSVLVQNRPPEVPRTPLSAPHHYESSHYVAVATVSPTWVDPDGDPMTVQLAYDEPAGTGCNAALESGEGASVLRLSCADPRALIGGTERGVRVTVTDVNGGATAASLPIAVQNRLPVVALAAGTSSPFAVGHTVGPCAAGTCFLASGASPFVASDPDGDPVTPVVVDPIVGATAAHSSSSASLGTDGTPRFEFATPVAYPAEFRTSYGTSPFSIIGRASDPWGEGSLAVAVGVWNRPPSLASAPPTGPVPHTYDRTFKAFVASAPGPSFVDPDGDPVTPGGAGDACKVDASSGDLVCSAPYDWQAGATTLPAFVGPHALTVRGSDGWEVASIAASFSIDNRAPTVTCSPNDTDQCYCDCVRWDDVTGDCMSAAWEFSPSWTQATANDADGDPLDVRVTDASGTRTLRALPPIAITATFSVGTYTYTVAASDGVASATRTCTKSVSCSRAGTACTL